MDRSVNKDIVVAKFGSVDERRQKTQVEPDNWSSQYGIFEYSSTGRRAYGKVLEQYFSSPVINLVPTYPKVVVQLRDSIQILEGDNVPISITGLQNRVKDSFAYSAETGLMVVANGEEKTQILSQANELLEAGISPPSELPTVVDDGAGNLTDGKFVVYQYVYAATSAYPLIENSVDIQGSIAPRSNPSPSSAAFEITGGGDRKNLVTVTKTERSDINKIWLFRTALLSTADLAETEAAAGLLYYIGEADNDGVAGTVDIEDDLLSNIGNSPVELDNFPAPTFRFCVYEDPYWWGFGNMPYVAEAVWDNSGDSSTGLVTVSDTDYFFGGRDGMYIRFEGISEGGIDNAGTFFFKQLTDRTGTVYTTDSETPVALPDTGDGTITISGISTTLYRSKRRNPLSWGYTQIIGNVTLPQIWALRVGGGMGTAITVIPDNPILQVATEYPALTATYNLSSAGTDQFAGTKKVISRIYSPSIHFSQFTAQVEGALYSWSMDYKNFVILQSNGVSIKPVAGPLPILLKGLTKSRMKQSFSHGIYDPQTEINAIWLATEDSIFTNNICIYQHAATGFWGVLNEYDVLCSSTVESEGGDGRQTWVGTESGFLGRAFVKDVFNNFLPPTGLVAGTVYAGDEVTIERDEGEGDFNTDDDGIIGNYVILVAADGLTYQIAIIDSVSASEITVNKVRQANGAEGAEFSPLPQNGDKFYIGVIECKLRKYFDFGRPADDKYVEELWVTALNTQVKDMKILYYPERSIIPTAQIDLYKMENTAAYYNQLDIPGQNRKTHGFEVVDRGYAAFQFISLALLPAGMQKDK